MERIRYLLCPQCGDRRFYLTTDAGERIYCKIDWNGMVLVGSPPTVTSPENCDLHDFACCGCSWRGPVRKLVRVFSG